MGSELNKIWNEQHGRYHKADWINKSSLFSTWAISFFPKKGKLLDLGCGQGQDSRFFNQHGYEVTGIDFSEKGIEFAREKSTGEKPVIDFQIADISDVLPFKDNTFDIVYSHLAVHYFDTHTTKKIFSEIYRILKKGGVLALLTNSTSDPEYNTGEKIEDDYFMIRGVKKRFFSVKTISDFVEKFTITLADDEGQTYKDRAISTTNLIRLVAKK